LIVIASANGNVGMEAAMEALRSGGSALDAVEAGTKVVELNRDDHSVGVGGYPNLLGEVELDASIMEGTTRRAGAVAALRDYPHPISVARAILDHLPQHLLLTGEGAGRFAAERGFDKMPLLTPETEEAWRQKTAGFTSGDAAHLSFQVRLAQDPERTIGTVNFVAQDAQGQIASAVSTSGWAFKYPGRVGDSALIGAGNYCDNRYGACACTGLGEWSIRAGTARMVVAGLKLGLSLADACEQALRDLADIPLPPDIEPVMNLIALDKDGNHTAYSTAEGRVYVWQTVDMAAYETAARVVV
jgi:beta-aspartyl-peptidase (threonine type)